MIQWFLKCDTDKNLQGPRMYLCAKFDLLRLEEFADKETEILYAVVSFDPVCLKETVEKPQIFSTYLRTSEYSFWTDLHKLKPRVQNPFLSSRQVESLTCWKFLNILK